MRERYAWELADDREKARATLDELLDRFSTNAEFIRLRAALARGMKDDRSAAHLYSRAGALGEKAAIEDGSARMNLRWGFVLINW